ncbi:FimV/HubP family polar landmark protein [Halomonas piscis]|uniref:FimV/HubP family polar landmark protein n=1 Tax=Halomonas piscis TaxID=3031727 RepID=UPI00289E7095|nr:FimV/HubP family polar landmark protein [Halomonas piscis]
MKLPTALAVLLAVSLAGPLGHADEGAQDSAGGDPAQRTLPATTYVSSGDALWHVAERVRPEKASVEQVMLALVEANPEAFPSGNINSMSANTELKVPDVERMLRRSKAQAEKTIDYMNIAWRIRGPEGPVHVPLGPPDAPQQTGREQGGQQQPSAPGLEAGEALSLEPEQAAGGLGALDQSVLAQVRELGQKLGQGGDAGELDALKDRLERVIGQRDRLLEEVSRLESELSRLTEELALQEVELARQEVQEGTPGYNRAGADEDRPASGTATGGAVSPASEFAVARRGMASLAAEYRWPMAAGALLLLALAAALWRYRQRSGHADDDVGVYANASPRSEEVAFEPSSQDNTSSSSY